MTPEPRTEPDSVYAPDPPPDHEAAQMILDMAREAVYVASEDGSDQYSKRPDRRRALLRLCLELELSDSPALYWDYERAARVIEAMQTLYFGGHSERFPGFRDATLVRLCQWLRNRAETRFDNYTEER